VSLDKGQRGVGVQKQRVGCAFGEAESGANQEGKTGEPLTEMHTICSAMFSKRQLIELPHDSMM
jgi:hypothetical protein